MSAVIEQIEILQDEWLGCYRGGWKGVIVDAAFAHPAKVAFNLAKRIYEHAIEEGWIKSGDVVCDPFGGIGGCAFHGLMNGMRVVTCELEQKFVDLSKENRELWRERFTGLPGFNADNWIILQGDSRKLASVIREAGLSVSSPPYAGNEKSDYLMSDDGRTRRRDEKRGFRQGHGSFRGSEGAYGQSEGQLGAMKEGDLSLAVSSPPYIESLKPETEEQTERKQRRIAESKSIYDGRKLEAPSAGKAGLGGGYGTTEGNLAAMPAGDLCVSSPPFPQPGSEEKPFDLVGQRTYQGRGGDRAEGNLETLANEGFQAAISSPPYEATRLSNEQTDCHRIPEKLESYGAATINRTVGEIDTFWSASRTILEQLYSVLTPGAHAIFIVKAFVRNRQIVDFPGQWAQLCESAGFKLIHDHHAMLTEHSGTQGGMFGVDKEHKVKRVSFFRRLHEKRAPETEIFYENVLCFERV